MEQRKRPVEGKDATQEIGATAGKTHGEVLEDVLGPERARKNLARAGPSPAEER